MNSVIGVIGTQTVNFLGAPNNSIVYNWLCRLVGWSVNLLGLLGLVFTWKQNFCVLSVLIMNEPICVCQCPLRMLFSFHLFFLVFSPMVLLI